MADNLVIEAWRKRGRTAVLVVVLLLVAAGGCGASSSPSEEAVAATETERPAQVLTKALMDPDFSPRLGTYTYHFHWLLKTGAESTITVVRIGDAYHMTTTASTGWFVDRVYRVRYRGVAVLDAVTLDPRRVEIDEQIRSTHKHTVMEYLDGTLHSARTKTKPKREPSRQEYVQDTKGGQVMDYFSAVLIARSMEWSEGDVRTVEVFDGKGLSWAELTFLGPTRVKIGKDRIEAWKIRVRIVQDGKDLDDDDKLIADNIELFLSADNSREILRIEADTPFGNMKVVLDSFKPAEPVVDAGSAVPQAPEH